MKHQIAFVMLCLAAAPAWAGEGVRPRLVPGGNALGLPSFAGESRAEVMTLGGFSLGSVSAPIGSGAATQGNGDGLALGGYAAFNTDWAKLSSSLSSGGGVGSADMTASQGLSLWGINGVASLSLGYQWTQAGGAGFSVNPAQMGVPASNWGNASDLSLSLSFTHDVTPSFSMGGFAAASRSGDEGLEPSSGLHFGAGLELKF